MATICDEFGIRYPEGNKSNKVFVSAIYEYLLHLPEKGRRAILVIEEAQNLSLDVLEQIRLLTNLETNQRKLLQIIFLGQPELREMLAQPQLRQLSQRVTARYHLGPLSKEETFAYVNHRLSIAGLTRGQLFSIRALNSLFRLTGGLPRLINVICDRVLLGAYVQGKDEVDRTTLIKAAREVSGEKEDPRRIKPAYLALSAFFVLLFFAVLASAYFYWRPHFVSSIKPRALSQTRIATIPIQEPSPVDLAKPVGGTRAGTRDMAFRALLSQWGIPSNSHNRKTPCEQALDNGLQCLNEKGGLSDLRRLNKPAVLTLLDGKGDEYFAAILSIQDHTATFAIGKETRKVDVRKIASWWLGEYTLFWKPPPNYKGKLDQALVTWVDHQLSIVQGRAVKPEEKLLYNKSMKKEIRAFQITAGLVPDGIVGPRTIICLANATDTGGPTLINKKRDH